MLEKLKNLVEELKAGLPTQSRLVLSESIDPTRALILREVCLFRITELAESAYDAFKKDNLIAAFILSRAIMETASLFWSFLNEIEKALATKDIEEIRIFLSSVLTGARASLAKELGRTLTSPHILKLIKNMDKLFLIIMTIMNFYVSSLTQMLQA